MLVPRETPLTATHLDNLAALARAGATVVPPEPAFYLGQRTIDDVIDFVARPHPAGARRPRRAAGAHAIRRAGRRPRLIPAFEAVKAIHDRRGDAVVVGTMTPTRYWDLVTDRPELDLPVFGAMGKASSIALGVALAQPGRRVVVLDGDGALLMNLGSLVTIAGRQPANLVHIVFDDGAYHTTGAGSPSPATDATTSPPWRKARASRKAIPSTTSRTSSPTCPGCSPCPAPSSSPSRCRTSPPRPACTSAAPTTPPAAS